jgi:hypothetical protein
LQANAGFFEEGITGVTGMPVFTYMTNASSLSVMFQQLYAAD